MSSCTCTYVFRAILEGDDKYENLAEIYCSVQRTLRKGLSTLDEESREDYDPRRIVFFGGGDMMYVSHVLGLHGKFSTKTGESCCWCEAPRHHLGKAQPSQKRTLERIYNLAHLPYPDPSANYNAKFPFECPGCHTVFKNLQVCVFTRYN